jgi:hypothetical protein
MTKIARPRTDAGRGDEADDTALGLQLVRDIARRSIARTRSAAADPADMGRSLPLPMPALKDLTLAQALEAAVHQLDELERRRLGEQADGLDGECGGALDHAPEIPPHIARIVRPAR